MSEETGERSKAGQSEAENDRPRPPKEEYRGSKDEFRGSRDEFRASKDEFRPKDDRVRNHIPSVVVSRGRSEGRSRSTRKKEEFTPRTRSYGEERRGGYSYRGTGRRRDEFSRRSEFKKSNDYDNVQLIGLPEDSRISTCLRRLSREEDEKKFADICKTLQGSLAHPDNTAYIRRSLDNILESLYALICNAVTPSCKKFAARTLGHVGFVLDKDFNKFMDWIFSKFHSEISDQVRTLTMTAIYELANLDKESPRLHDFAQKLMTDVREIMEITYNGEIFIMTTEITLTLTHRYPDTFTQYFNDTIDIIVGWHIDPAQPRSVTKCAAKALKRLAPYWLNDMSFTVTLLQQFLEDSDACFEELTNPKKPSEDEEPISKDDQLTKITAFILVFKSVFKGLDKNMSPAVCPNVTNDFLENSLCKVIEIVLKSLTISHHNDLIIAGNKCIILILEFINSESDIFYTSIVDYISSIITKKLTEKPISTLLKLISKLCISMPNKTSVEFIDYLLAPDSFLLSKRLTSVDADVIAVYESLLNHSQDAVVLQSYKHIVEDFDALIRSINPNLESICTWENNIFKDIVYDEEKAVDMVIFMLRILQEISLKQNLILEPSLFEIFAVFMPKVFKASNHPIVHQAYMNLLRLHCIKNNYFIQTEPVQNAETQMNILIKLLIENLNDSSMDVANKSFVIRWANDILSVANDKLKMSSVEIVELTKGIFTSCSDTRPGITSTAINILQNVLIKYKGLWPPELISKILDLCVYFLNSNLSEVRKHFHRLMMLLPSVVAVFSLNSFFQNGLMNDAMVRNYRKLAKCEESSVEQTSFTLLMKYLIKEENTDPDFKWMTELVARGGLDAGETQELMSNIGLIQERLAYEAATHCRDARLKTALGKPIQTCTTIENAIRDLALETKTSKNSLNCATGRRVRLLLQFVEQLEKVVYNAAEGTASAFPYSTIPQVKTFFSKNRGSCYDWFSRMRFVTMIVAIHCGMAACAVRHGFALLQSHFDNNTTNVPEFRITLVNVGWALANMGEADAIAGLYEWAKTAANVKEPILEPLIDVAARKYEAASDKFLKFSHLLSSEETENMIDSNKVFIADQLTESYLALNNWQDLAEWKKLEMKFFTNENGCSSRRYKNITLNYAESMAKYDDGDLEGAKELLKWNDDEIFFPKERTSWDYNNILQETDYILKCTMVKDGSKAKYEEAKNLAETIIEECIKDSPSELIERAVLLKYTAHSLLSGENYAFSPFYGANFCWSKLIKSPEMERLAWWGHMVDERSQNKSPYSKDYLLQCVKSSRKIGNIKYATKLLLKCVVPGRSLEEVAEDYMIDLSESDYKMHKTMVQVSKLLKTQDVRSSLKLSSSIAFKLSKSAKPEMKVLGASVLRNIASEIKRGKIEDLRCPELDQLLNLDEKILSKSFEEHDCFGNVAVECGMSDEESLTGRLLRLSLKTCPNSSKSWERVASWAYSAGVKESTKGIVSTEEEKAALESQLPDGVTIESVCSILAAYHSHDVDAYAVSAEMIGQQLLELKFTPQQIDSLLSTWKKTHSHVYSFFRLSVHSYFNFIQISENQENNVVTATLRLLRLIVRHASELQNVVESGLAATLTAPWTAIVPQLFSRLNHPEPYVRRCLSELLIRIGNDTPHLIIFPAVVGSDSSIMPTTNISVIKYKKTPTKNQDDEEIEEDDDEDYEEEEENNERSSVLENSFTLILDELSKKYGQEISQVKTFIYELRRITLLWDELWLGALNRHQADINRRFNQLNTEIKSTETNTSLDKNTKKFIISEKYRLILKPILFALEQLKAITFVTPETPHEKSFQEKYSKDIENIINKLKHPENLEDPIDECVILSTLIANFQASLGSGRQRGGYLSMKEISPALVKLKFSKIAMPGVVKDPATIKSISDTVTVLPTNTKPKKLVFHGSNGLSYTYLFKGLEDLHLDERIMQFLSIANSMLKETNLRAHHYSVVPLGARSGLISWVDDLTPIFWLYKKWQDRVVTEENKESMRVSNLFYSKLAPLLKEVGINSINMLQRNKWPQKVLKKVLTDLMQITPNYLLSKELWCYSLNAAKWWNVTKLYSTSLAVMSMIGYVIGLGDRHLDNVLVNLKTGEVVHIDYNVCFEKGKTLFVPEKVPFRLTQNLSTALGVTGIEGTYRRTCERVLEVLRQGQETLLTLLEAFVYDPLIDWTPMNEAGYAGAVYGGGRILASETRQSKKDLEHEVTTCMLKVRLTEVKQQWLENKNNLRSELRELQKAVENWIQDEKNAHQCQEELKERHTQMAVLKEAEGQPQHSLYTVGRRYAKHLQVYSARQKTLETLNAKVQEYESFIDRYRTVMNSLRGVDLPNWISEVKSRPMTDNCQVFDLIKEFLHNAGQGSMVQQCINSEKEVGELCLQQTQVTAKILELLVQYGEISRQYPFSLLARHRAVLYKKWAEQLLLDLSPITCKNVIDEMAKMLMVTEDAIRQAGMYSAGLHRHAAEASAWLAKAKYRYDNNAAPSNTSFSVLEKIKMIESSSLTGVVLTALCALNKKLIMVENQTVSAGDCLLNLTSRDGDWFLDDMCTLTSTAVKLAKLLPEDVSSSVALNAIQSAANQYNSLQGLHNNFMGIILVEAMQALQSEEPTVVNMVSKLENAIGSVLLPLSEILIQLQNQLRNVILGSMTKDPSLTATIQMLKVHFHEMFPAPGQMSLSQGDMLLIGFDGLFVDLEQGRKDLLGHLKTLKSPPSWKIVDQIREAIHLYTAPVHQDTAIKIIEDMFFIKKIQTMLEVFRMVRADASGFRGAPSPQVPHDRDTLTRPVRKYIADYISYQMLGVFSLPLATFICLLLEKENFDVTGEVEQKDIGTESRVPLDELCKKMIEKLCNQQQVRQASGVVSQAEAIWRQEDMLARQERELNNARALDHRLRLTLMAHHWIHEHCLLNATPPLNRANFIMEIKNATTAVISLQQKIKDAVTEQNNLIMSAEQRLKWASGANPALSEVMSAFHSSVCTNKQRISDETNLTFTLLNICNTILYYELLRTPTTDAIEHDKSFAILVSECEKTYYLVSKTTSAVSLSPSEEGLLSLLPPDKKIDQEWIRNVGDKISDSIRKLNAKQDVLYSNCFQSDELVKSKATAIRTIMAKHHRMIADIRTLLKNLVKIDEIGPPGLNEYLSQYKKFTDLISSMTKSLAMSVTLNSTILNKALEDSLFLSEQIPFIYKNLLEFGTSDILSKRPPLLRQATVCESPKKGEDPKKPKKSGVQERNAYATNVLRRVKFKLEGRDPDPGVRSSIKQQVDWTISEATSLDNLSLLYEGWTPWV